MVGDAGRRRRGGAGGRLAGAGLRCPPADRAVDRGGRGGAGLADRAGRAAVEPVLRGPAGNRRERGIAVREAEARRIARRMLWFALGGHLATAAVAGVITYYSGSTVGYYFIGSYLLSAVIRPAAAYFSHLRERIGALSRESRHPREDIVSLRERVDRLAAAVKALQDELPRAQRELSENLRRTETALTDGISHARNLLTADLTRLQAAQAADRDAGLARGADLARRVDNIARRIEDTLDRISDHAELQAGLRALV